MKAMRAAEPQKPKEITVVAGDGKHVKIQLCGDQNEDSRKQVAEAAGLKHVPLPDFDDSDSSAWAGSLKKTAKVKTMAGREGRMADKEKEEEDFITLFHLRVRQRPESVGRISPSREGQTSPEPETRGERRGQELRSLDGNPQTCRPRQQGRGFSILATWY